MIKFLLPRENYPIQHFILRKLGSWYPQANDKLMLY